MHVHSIQFLKSNSKLKSHFPLFYVTKPRTNRENWQILNENIFVIVKKVICLNNVIWLYGSTWWFIILSQENPFSISFILNKMLHIFHMIYYTFWLSFNAKMDTNGKFVCIFVVGWCPTFPFKCYKLFILCMLTFLAKYSFIGKCFMGFRKFVD